MKSMARLMWFAASLVVAAGFIWLWQAIVDARLVSPVYLPGPDRAWAALQRGFNGDLRSLFLQTIERMIYGWLLASLAGIVVGTMIGSSALTKTYLGPTLEFIRPMPASATIPVAIALLGLTETTALAVITFGAVWPVMLATIHGFAAVEPRLYELAKVLRLTKRDFIFKIALPSAMPDILAGMSVGLTVALILTVVSEMLTSRPGLGQWILIAARSFRAPELFAGVILLGLIGLVSALLLSYVESRLLSWRSAR